MEDRHGADAGLIAELRDIQARCGWLPEDELRALSRRLQVPLYRLEGLASFFPHFRRAPRAGREVQVCVDLPCRLRSPDLLAAAQGAADPAARCAARSCLGQCDRPAAVVVDGRVCAAMDESSIGVLIGDGAEGAPPPAAWQIDPYGGGRSYAALDGVLGESPSDVIEMLKASGLRGMGGAGFSAGAKWEIVRAASAAEKYVICNADESEPGTIKDRFLLDHFADLVVEGVAIAAVVVGAQQATVYVRHEYEAQRQNLALAIRRFADSPHGGRVRMDIFESPGGYICGEETALLEVMEGRRAEPRNKPPFPGTHGLWGRPTLINNVETLAWVPAIVRRGAEWFANQGVNGARGLKLMAVTGDVARPGVYEVPLGTRAIELIEGHAGGVGGGRRLKAFFPGGPSSGLLPASAADVPLDFESVRQAGAMLGSGAVIVLAEGRCVLDAAVNALHFFRRESCGKCVPCRVGTEKLVLLAERLSRGAMSDTDAAAFDDVAAAMELTSICGLGQTAPAALRSVLRHFPEEIAAHRAGRCPEGVTHA